MGVFLAHRSPHGAKMRQKSNSTPASSEALVRNIRRATRKHHAAEEKIRIVLDGLRGETSIAELCGREGIAESMYYSWSKVFLEAGKRRLAGDTARAATTDEVKQLRREAQDLKEGVPEQAREVRLRQKNKIREVGDQTGGSPHLRNLRSSASSSNRICRLGERCRCSGSSHRRSTAGMNGFDMVALKLSKTSRRSRIGSGTAFPTTSGGALS